MTFDQYLQLFPSSNVDAASIPNDPSNAVNKWRRVLRNHVDAYSQHRMLCQLRKQGHFSFREYVRLLTHNAAALTDEQMDSLLKDFKDVVNTENGQVPISTLDGF